MVNRQDDPYSLASPGFGRGLLSAEIIFDGTKLALVAGPSQNRYGWYELVFIPLTQVLAWV
jgi:hypothetical protein